MPRVLIADDQPDVLLALKLLLKGEGWESEAVDSPEGVLAAVSRGGFDAVVMDLNYARDTTSGKEGLDLLPRLRALDDGLPVLTMTAWGTIGLAVEAMRRGATDFVLKPWDNAALVRTLRSHLDGNARREHSAAQHDLVVARRVQSRLLPEAPPALRTLECAGRCVQAGAVGGDAYDFLDLGRDRVGIMLADASGKGIAAALLMANLQASLRSHASVAASDLPAFLRAVNGQFLAATAPEHYATLFFGVYDDESRLLRYANCGHNPPVLLRADGSAERLAATAPVLGLVEGWKGTANEVVLGAGDTLLVFTDGLTEAEGPADEEFGEARLFEALRACADHRLDLVPGALLEAVEAFAGPVHEDDRTVLVARGR
jgi:sigma-B regulation protein RsbU (phosphoserine phosphatase)